MKRLFLLLWGIVFCLSAINATESDSMLVKTNKSGRTRIRRIVEEQFLNRCLVKRPYYAFTFGGTWLIVVKESKGITAYYRIYPNEPRKKHFPKGKRELNSPFSIVSTTNLKNIVRTYYTEYVPFFIYFVICDSDHNVLFEWNSQTSTDDYGFKIWKSLFRSLSYILMRSKNDPEVFSGSSPLFSIRTVQ